MRREHEAQWVGALYEVSSCPQYEGLALSGGVVLELARALWVHVRPTVNVEVGEIGSSVRDWVAQDRRAREFAARSRVAAMPPLLCLAAEPPGVATMQL